MRQFPRRIIPRRALRSARTLEHLRQVPFDLALLDLLLPDMDGWSLLRHIRELRPSVRVVILCGDVDADGTIEAFRLGAVEVLLKPPDVDKLLRFLDDLTRRGEDERRTAGEID